MSTSLQLYRDLVPEHATVPDATVEVWLEVAAQRHTASAWGAAYTTAMVMWAADQLHPQVLAGAFPADGGCAPAAPSSSAKAPTGPSRFRVLYEELRDTRSAGAPGWVSPWA